MAKREWTWRCAKCALKYTVVAGELPPEYCTRTIGFSCCRGAEFLKIDERTAETPANLDAWASKQQP